MRQTAKAMEPNSPGPARPVIDVLMATTSYPLDAADWKGRFIHDLAAGLDRSGGVQLRLWGPPGQLPGRVQSANSTDDAAWLHQMAGEGGIAHLLRRRPLTGVHCARELLGRLRSACRRDTPDLYHVNWLQLLLGLPDDGRPVYVAVLGSDFGLLRLPGMRQLLRRAMQRRRVMLAPNAGWMAPRLQEAFGDLAEIRPNPFGVDPAWFEVRRDPTVPPAWLVVTRVTRAKLGYLLEWGQGLFGETRRLRLLGPMQERVALPGWVDYGGATSPPRLQAEEFPLASGLLTLSRHDEGRPQVMIEAMAAGLPVVASDLPAHRDLVRDGETGWLVDNPARLHAALQATEQTDLGRRMGALGRSSTASDIGTWDDHARRCVAAYQQLLEGAHRNGA
jgi:hypothetical protein